jgi:hypothetical protein
MPFGSQKHDLAHIDLQIQQAKPPSSESRHDKM